METYHNKKIYSAGPSISQKEIDYVTDAITNAWYDGAYAYIEEFEQAVARYVGRSYALALPSGTSAIHLSLLAAGVKKGDEVIIPDFTWVGTSAPCSYLGAKPVFVDVDKENWCICADEVQRHITKNTKAIYTVDLFGNMPDYDKLKEIALANNLVLLEDSAEAIGSSYKGRKAGSFGKASIFSFHGSKLLTTGEGGMLLTDDKEFYERAVKLANCGRDSNSSKMFWFDEIGFKYKYTSLQAAMGLAQIERVDDIVAKRKLIFSWYQEELADVKGLRMNTPGIDVDSNYWMSTIVPDSTIYDIKKEILVQELKAHNIESRPVVYQLSKMPAYNDLHQKWDNPVASEICMMGMNLPTPDILQREDVTRICGHVKEILIRYRK